MNPLLVTLGLRAFQFLLSAPKLRAHFSTTLTAERHDVSPAVVAALSGNMDAIKLLSDELDEAIRTNQAIVKRLELRARADGNDAA